MQLFYCDEFVLPLPPSHRFPMQKYALLRERLLRSGGFPANCFCVPPGATEAQLLRVHDSDYYRRVTTGELTEYQVKLLGFPWSDALIERSRRSVGGTIAASRSALTEGVSVNLAGGTHHAFRDRGEGFCVFNDAVVAVRTLQAERAIERAVILDCDVHQGNGTASLAAGDGTLFTLSIHGERNYPLRKEQSDLDVPLPDGTGDQAYLQALKPALITALNSNRPQLAIYLAGADPFMHDRFGRLALTKDGLARRDRLVFELCRSHQVPVAVTMAGGYASDISDIVDIHSQTVRLAAELLGRSPESCL